MAHNTDAETRLTLIANSQLICSPGIWWMLSGNAEEPVEAEAAEQGVAAAVVDQHSSVERYGDAGGGARATRSL